MRWKRFAAALPLLAVLSVVRCTPETGAEQYDTPETKHSTIRNRESAIERRPGESYAKWVLRQQIAESQRSVGNTVPSDVKNIMVELTRITDASGDFNFRGGDFIYRGKNVSARGGSGIVHRGGLNAAVITSNLAARLSTVSERNSSQESVSQMVTVLDGGEAYINVGEVFYTTKRVGRRRRRGRRGRDIEVILGPQQVGEFLVVRPRIVRGDLIEIAIAKESSRASHRGEVIHAARTATTVRCMNGQSIIIGGLMSGGTVTSKRITGGRVITTSGNTVFLLTPTILEP